MAVPGFTARLREVIDGIGGQNALARAAGLSQSGIARLVQGGEPTLSTLQAIAKASGRSLLWLADGVVDSLQGSGVAVEDQTDVVMLPLLDVVAGAGDGVDNAEPDFIGHLPFSREKLQVLGIKVEKVRAHELRGDSMEPTIMDRSCVLVDIAKRDLVDGRIYSLRAPEGLRVKRVQRQMDGSVLLISDNKERYQPERVSAEDAERISVLGRVFWADKLL